MPDHNVWLDYFTIEEIQNQLPGYRTSDTYNIPVQIHVARSDNGNMYLPWDSDYILEPVWILEGLLQTQEYLTTNETSIKLYINGVFINDLSVSELTNTIDYIDKSAYLATCICQNFTPGNTCDPDGNGQNDFDDLVEINSDDNRLDIYFVGALICNNLEPFGKADGIALDPESSTAIVIRDGVVTPGDEKYNESTIVHEIGHTLGLYHTHQRWNNVKENITRDPNDPTNCYNCTVKGDYLCDTNADPMFVKSGQNQNISQECQYYGNETDDCGESYLDSNYPPEEENILSYAFGHCRNHFQMEQIAMMQAIYTILYSIEGCTDPTAYNYDPTATTDDGSCTGQKGDINLDECVNVIDITLLVDMILQGTTYDGNIYEHWAANMVSSDPETFNMDDLSVLADYILNHPSCSDGSQRTITNSFITLKHQSQLSRGEDDILEIILSTETIVRAAQFEFLFPDAGITDVYMSDEFPDITLDWRMRSDTLAIVLYGAHGEVIPTGTNHIACIEYDDPLGRGDYSTTEYINGYYAGDAGILYTIVMSDQMNQNQTIPDQFILHQPFPNPFNPVTTIAYDLPLDGSVKIAVYNLTGEMITVLESGFKSAGSYKIQWEAENLASGLYFIRFNCGRFSATEKLLLLK